jgi:Zn-dependent protease/CBS domain-containing protein
VNKQFLSLGKIFGIPLAVDYSWFLIFALLTWTLATGYFPSEFKNWPTAQYWIVGGVTAFLFFGSVLLHEIGHSLVALRFNIPVHRIVLYIFGGASELGEESPGAWTDFWITLVGPAVNLVLWVVLSLVNQVLPGSSPLKAVVEYLAYINLLLGLFNLIPGYPLDGGKILMAVIWGVTHKRPLAVMAAATVGSIFAYILIFIGVALLFSGNILNGIWIAFIGWFILNASGGAARRERIKSELAGHTVSEAMSRAYVTINADTPLQALVDEHILGGGRRSLLVKQGDTVVGLATMHILQTVPKEDWPNVTVSEVMIPTQKMKQISPQTGIWEAMEAMDKNGVNQLPVMDDGQVQGILSREDVISFLRRLVSTDG